MKQLTEVMGRTENRRAFLKNSMVAGAVANEARCGWSAGREDACPIEKMSGEFQSHLATEVSATPDDRTTKLGVNIPSTEYSVMSYDAQTLAQKAASGDYLRDYANKNGQLTAIASASLKFENPGTAPAISAEGRKNAIVWAISPTVWNGPDNPLAGFYAFDSTKLGHPIYTSEQDTARDGAALATPLVANGGVHGSTRSEVEV